MTVCFFLLTLNRCFPTQKWFEREKECYTLSPYSFVMYGKYIPESVWQIVQKSLHSLWMKIATNTTVGGNSSCKNFLRGNRSQLFSSISIPKNFAKHKWWKGLSFCKDADYDRCNKEPLHRRCFHVNNMKFLRVAF